MSSKQRESQVDDTDPQSSTKKKKHHLQGGYECIFVEEPPKQVQTECSICLCLLRDPYLVNCCGNSFCRTCIEPIKTDGKPCPLCNENFTICIPNKQLQRTLKEMQVYCSYKQGGCKWIGELRELNKHLNVDPSPENRLTGCEFAVLRCTYCKEGLSRQDIKTHECLQRPFSCDYCHNYSSTYEDVVSNHWPVCGSRPAPCPNECGTYPEKKMIKRHIAEECPLQVIECPFKQAGCEVVLTRQEMPGHIAEQLSGHLTLQAVTYNQKLVKLEADLNESKYRIDELVKENVALRNQIDQLVAQAKSMEDSYKEQITKLRDELEAAIELKSQKQKEEMLKVCDDVRNEVKGEVSTLKKVQNEKIQRIMLKQEASEQQVTRIQKVMKMTQKQEHSGSDGLEKTSRLSLRSPRQSPMRELVPKGKPGRSRSEPRDTKVSFDTPSRLMVPPAQFTMHDFEKHRREDTSWYSPPFYTHPQGYKMCLRVDANGYGEYKGTHVSVCVYLMRGEFDDYLKWPFRGDVTIKLDTHKDSESLESDVRRTETNHDITEIVEFHDNDDDIDDITRRVVDDDMAEVGYGYHDFIPHKDLKTMYLMHDSLVLQIPSVKVYISMLKNHK